MVDPLAGSEESRLSAKTDRGSMLSHGNTLDGTWLGTQKRVREGGVRGVNLQANGVEDWSMKGMHLSTQGRTYLAAGWDREFGSWSQQHRAAGGGQVLDVDGWSLLTSPRLLESTWQEVHGKKYFSSVSARRTYRSTPQYRYIPRYRDLTRSGHCSSWQTGLCVEHSAQHAAPRADSWNETHGLLP